MGERSPKEGHKDADLCGREVDAGDGGGPADALTVALKLRHVGKVPVGPGLGEGPPSALTAAGVPNFCDTDSVTRRPRRRERVRKVSRRHG